MFFKLKGMILYGPPGTGKTLIARKIAQALHGVHDFRVCARRARIATQPGTMRPERSSRDVIFAMKPVWMPFPASNPLQS